jgi:hypothetical protein
VLVIAIAVGWYLYTTFAAAGQQGGLVVSSATIYKPPEGEACLLLQVVPQGAASVEIVTIEVAGKSYSGQDKLQEKRFVSGPTQLKVDLDVNVAVGQVLTGRVVLSNGAMTPFTATVVSGQCPQQ